MEWLRSYNMFIPNRLLQNICLILTSINRSCNKKTIFLVQSSISISLIMVILNKPRNNPQNKIYPCNSYSINWTTTNDCSVQVRKISFAFMKEYCAISPYFRYNYILILYIDIYCVFRRHIRAIKPNIPSSMRINQTLKTKILHIFTYNY